MAQIKTQVRIFKLAHWERENIRQTVRMAMEYWPNAHLGDMTRLQDMRSAFKLIRDNAQLHGLDYCIQELQRSAYRHQDM